MGPWEACFGAELDWEKLWRTRCSGPKCDRGRLVLDRIRLGKAVAGPGVRVKMTETNGHKLLFF